MRKKKMDDYAARRAAREAVKARKASWRAKDRKNTAHCAKIADSLELLIENSQD